MVVDLKKFTPHPDVVHTELRNGDSVLLHLGTHTYYRLNQTGSVIWELIQQGTPLREIGQAIESRYLVSLQEARQSVLELIEELESAHLIDVADA